MLLCTTVYFQFYGPPPHAISAYSLWVYSMCRCWSLQGLCSFMSNDLTSLCDPSLSLSLSAVLGPLCLKSPVFMLRITAASWDAVTWEGRGLKDFGKFCWVQQNITWHNNRRVTFLSKKAAEAEFTVTLSHSVTSHCIFLFYLDTYCTDANLGFSATWYKTIATAGLWHRGMKTQKLEETELNCHWVLDVKGQKRDQQSHH